MICRDEENVHFETKEDFDEISEKQKEFKKEAKGNKQKYSELFMGWILSLPIKQ